MPRFFSSLSQFSSFTRQVRNTNGTKALTVNRLSSFVTDAPTFVLTCASPHVFRDLASSVGIWSNAHWDRCGKCHPCWSIATLRRTIVPQCAILTRFPNRDQQGCYYHELFLRGHPNLTGYMRRVGAPKGIDRRKIKTLEGDDPNLYEFPALKG
jgi:hypothetical protein